MQCLIMHSKFQTATNQYQIGSSSQCLLQIQVQAHQEYSNSLTIKMVPSLRRVENFQNVEITNNSHYIKNKHI